MQIPSPAPHDQSTVGAPATCVNPQLGDALLSWGSGKPEQDGQKQREEPVMWSDGRGWPGKEGANV